MSWFSKKRPPGLPTPDRSLPGMRDCMAVPETHAVSGAPLEPPFPAGMEQAVFGMGCFWGAERLFWQRPGVYTTAVGYAGGFTPNPTYEEVCSRPTGHTEVVLVVFDPAAISLRRAAQASSGRATTRPRACARATTSAPSTAPRSTPTTTAQRGRRRGLARGLPAGAERRPATARSRPRSPTRPSSTTPRTTTSSTWPRTPTATAASAAPASAAPHRRPEPQPLPMDVAAQAAWARG